MTSTQETPPPQKTRDIGDGLSRLFANETIAYICKRILQAIVTLFLASILCFTIIQLAPGDYLDQFRTLPNFSQETIEQFSRQFGLDKSPVEQYWRWLTQILTRGNFGESFSYQRPVAGLLIERVEATLLLAICSLIVTWAIAIPLGIVGAINQNRWLDKFLQTLSYTGQGFPSFITALSLLILAQNVSPLLPVGNMSSVYYADLTPVGKILDIGWHMILPTIALSVTSFAGLQRITRGQLLDVLRQDYIRTARAKGLPENRVIYTHALRNAINPLITIIGFEFASLLSGSFIAEFFFNWPGLGRLILEGVQAKDLYLVMASLMMGAVMLIIGNLLADLLLTVVDPRIKLDDLQ
ncbi:MAG: ABC transporter permease [Cyanobacteriota bacterium]|nr:ABC transporter permease [Cyanobacteriota bacterium]